MRVAKNNVPLDRVRRKRGHTIQIGLGYRSSALLVKANQGAECGHRQREHDRDD
jgi:hypothetical protein